MNLSIPLKPLGELALAGIMREFPHAELVVEEGPTTMLRPRERHPAFFGCFDWHSAVHAHWCVWRVLQHTELQGAREALRLTLTAENIQRELEYFTRKGHESFERPYGWAWLLKLAADLSGTSDPDGKVLREALQPLERLLVERFLDFLPKQTYPVRAGTHGNSAFAMILALDYARKVGCRPLEVTICERALEYFGNDKGFPQWMEPCGNDFLSPVLVEALLMAHVLHYDGFETWFSGLLPDGIPPSLSRVPIVSDRSDGQIGHLDGLTLSRSWCLLSIAQLLPPGSEAATACLRIGREHLDAGLHHVRTGYYAGEHWLATFALLALEAALESPIAIPPFLNS